MLMSAVHKALRSALPLAALAVFACATVSTPVSGQDAKPAVRVVGTYTNMRYTPDHAYGYLVDLWQHGDQIVGLFQFSEGAQTDFDTGALDNVTYDRRTGALAFESYVGMFQFTGTLTKDALSGRLLRAARIGTDRTQQDNITLQRSAKASAFLRPHATIEEWRQMAEDTLKRRGPKNVKK